MQKEKIMKIGLVIITAILLIAITPNSYASSFDEKFEWVKQTFEENDAGFRHIINKKGVNAYNIHNQMIRQRVNEASTLQECALILNEWLRFFRFGHIGLEILIPEEVATSEIGHSYWAGNVSEFEDYIRTKTDADFEGIWDIREAYKVGIVREGDAYIGFIIDSIYETWKPNLVKLRIEQDDNGLFSTFYMFDFSPVVSREPELLGENVLRVGNFYLTRLSPNFPNDPTVDSFVKQITAQNPFIERLNEHTLYLRIPSFMFEAKPYIDRLIADNMEQITQTENLIIDIRNGTGGSDVSFSSLIPILYTNPIRNNSVEFLATELNSQTILSYAYMEGMDEGSRQHARLLYNLLQENLGDFVNPFGLPAFMYSQDKVYEYPKNIGIIMNRVNGSTDEQFLLSAKQSKKVKLFGESTMGALDISNMTFADSPCGALRLHYGMSKSLRLPRLAIDDFGIQPDFFLDESIPQYKWVEYVTEIMSGWVTETEPVRRRRGRR
jgi:hypothetical protein